MENIVKKVNQKFDDNTAFMFEELINEISLDDITGRSDRLDDMIHEIADSIVSVYYYNQVEWLLHNLDRADQEEAVAMGAKTAEQIAAYCWYMTNKKDLEEAVNYAADLLSE